MDEAIEVIHKMEMKVRKELESTDGFVDITEYLREIEVLAGMVNTYSYVSSNAVFKTLVLLFVNKLSDCDRLSIARLIKSTEEFTNSELLDRYTTRKLVSLLCAATGRIWSAAFNGRNDFDWIDAYALHSTTYCSRFPAERVRKVFSQQTFEKYLIREFSRDVWWCEIGSSYIVVKKQGRMRFSEFVNSVGTFVDCIEEFIKNFDGNPETKKEFELFLRTMVAKFIRGLAMNSSWIYSKRADFSFSRFIKYLAQLRKYYSYDVRELDPTGKIGKLVLEELMR